MSRYATSVPTREKVEDSNSVPKPPQCCGVDGCQGRPEVLTLVVLDNGRERAGAFCDFGFTRSTEKGRELHMRKDYTFVEWVARCGYHHLRDLYRSGKGRWSSMAKTDRITPAEVEACAPAVEQP